MSSCHQTGADIAHSHRAPAQRHERAHFIESSPVVAESPLALRKLAAMLVNVTLLLFIVVAAALARRSRQQTPD